MARPRRRAAKTSDVAQLFALDAAALMERLDAQRVDMVRHFSRQRTRDALLEPLRCWSDTARFEDLLPLSKRQRVAVTAFTERLRALRWYLTYTEDMPAQLNLSLASHLTHLHSAFDDVRRALGVTFSR